MTSRKIAVFTGTRAEYGLLYWLMKDIQAAEDLDLQLLASGAHFSPEFGFTYQQIEADGFIIDEKVETLLSSDSSAGVAKSIGLGVIGFTDALSRLVPDALVILGDRFEALAAAQTAMILRIPVIHLHGGEISEGAYDDAIRHAITKFSHYHCTSMEAYRQRVIQLGEAPERVFNVGALGLDHLNRSQMLSLDALSTSLNFSLHSPFFVVTYHPVTLADEEAIASFQALLDALEAFPQHQVILTYPNADDGGRQIIPMIDAYAAAQPERVLAIPSLGQQRYLSAVKHAAAVIGNSSSGIIEVPSFDVPTVNIGARQQGRVAAKSVIHCSPNTVAIKNSITHALNQSYKRDGDVIINPYGEGNSSEQIIQLLRTLPLKVMKTFYDLPSSVT